MPLRASLGRLSTCRIGSPGGVGREVPCPLAQLSSLILSGKIEQKGGLELNPSGKQSPGEPSFWSLLECQGVMAGEGDLEMDGPARPMTVPMGWATLASSLFLGSGLL